MKLKLTFFNTEKIEHGNGIISHYSTTPKAVYDLEYNTNNYKRAFAFAERRKRKLKKDNKALGSNTRLEIVGE